MDVNEQLAGDRPEEPREVLGGVWAWSARHPEWHPGEFGARVTSWALDVREAALLVDPLIPLDEPGPALALIDRLAVTSGRAAVLITIPYHVRSAEAIRERLVAAGIEVTVHGHAACRKRLGSTAGFAELEPGLELPGGAVGYAIGRPRRFEMPLYLPSHDAIAFGDAIVGTGNGLRMWTAKGEVDEPAERFYSERFAPTLTPLAELRAANVLVSHGPSAIGDGADQLERALALPPWYHPG
jgi:hypothetical protein